MAGRVEDAQMRSLFARLIVALAAMTVVAGVAAADTIKVGIIGPFSGPFALQGKNFKAGVDAYLALNGAKVGGHEMEILYRDLQTPDPAKAKAIAQELIVKDKVQYLGGVYFTPNALAITPLLEQANVPLVIFNAATSAITQKSPYVVRTSFTLWQTAATMAKVAQERGVKTVITAVTDYGPGVDAETAFKKTFEQAGGKVVEAIRMPLRTTDFNPIMQRIKDAGAEAVFAFLPSGPPTLGFVKAYNENGLKERGVHFLATGDLTQECDLPAIGDPGIGILTTFHYAVSHKSAANEAFVKAATKALGSADELTFPAVGAFDGMRVIAKMIETTGGKQDAAKAIAAVKGFAWESPRGPLKLDPETRSVTQNIYLRVVEKEGGKLINKEIKTYPDIPDLGFTAGN
jgi:branched-chain amino acid transport system substrate-binding protein